MTTTNYENSKKLHELGFGINNTSLFGWFSKPMVSPMELVGKWIVTNGIKEGYNFDFYSFDLETILEALPKWVENKFRRVCEFEMGKDGMSYCYYDYLDRNAEFEVWRDRDESLADTAARLLILLAEQGIINFK